jgi:ABC-type protease/lipase transport system fused ATPase/permease subunit
MVIQDGAVASFGTKEEVQGRIQMLKNGMIHIND